MSGVNVNLVEEINLNNLRNVFKLKKQLQSLK